VSRVLVIDDEQAIRDAVEYALRNEGFEVDGAGDGETGLQAALEETFDVVVLDLMLPRMSGTEVCRRLRTESAVPIIMLTAKGSELDRVLGLEIGADDYVTKPFSMAELIGRIRAIIRRRDLDRSGATSVIRVGDLELDPIRHEVKIQDEQKRLTPSEFKLLMLLAQDPERVFSRREIMQHLWDSTYVGDQRACDIHISNLRQKIEDDPTNPERVLTVRGIGYKLASVESRAM
jgi:two-component system, OmpR family, response regulator RegX3